MWTAYRTLLRVSATSSCRKLRGLEGVRRAGVLYTSALLKLRLVVPYLNNRPYYPYPCQRVRQAAAALVYLLHHLLLPLQ